MLLLGSTHTTTQGPFFIHSLLLEVSDTQPFSLHSHLIHWLRFGFVLTTTPAFFLDLPLENHSLHSSFLFMDPCSSDLYFELQSIFGYLLKLPKNLPRTAS
jgi:hypothetical protein